MIAEEHDDRRVEQAGLFELSDLAADPLVHRGDVVVGPRHGIAHVRGVRIEWRQRNRRRVDDRGRAFHVRERPALVRAGVIDDGEERLPLGAHIAFYRQYEASIGKANMMLASSTYGVGLENTQLSSAEGDGIILATSFVDDLGTT